MYQRSGVREPAIGVPKAMLAFERCGKCAVVGKFSPPAQPSGTTMNLSVKN
jgi:hypothetical protein